MNESVLLSNAIFLKMFSEILQLKVKLQLHNWLYFAVFLCTVKYFPRSTIGK